MENDKYFYFNFTPPSVLGHIYFSVETYFSKVVPKQCTKGKYFYSDGTFVEKSHPLVSFRLYEAGNEQYLQTAYYGDQYHRPFLLKTYEAGKQYTLRVRYTWYGSPHKDFTVKAYSKFPATVKILNKEGAVSNMLFTDGRSPTEFTDSQYCGMTTDCAAPTKPTVVITGTVKPEPPTTTPTTTTPTTTPVKAAEVKPTPAVTPTEPVTPTPSEPTEPEEPKEKVIYGFWDLLNKSTSVSEFFSLLFSNLWVLAVFWK